MVLKPNRTSFIIFAPSLIWLFFQLYYNGLFYTTVDDLLIQDIVRGAYTGGAWDGVFISPILSVPLSCLYSCVPGINWLGCLYFFVMLTSMIVSDLILCFACKDDLKNAFFSSIVAFICWYQMWLNFSFTTVAYGAAIAGGLVLIAVMNNGRYSRGLIVTGVLLIVLGSIIRVDVLLSIVLVLMPWGILSFLGSRSWKGIAIIAFLLTLYLGVTIIGKCIVSVSETEKAYHRWNTVRSELGDFMTPEDVLSTGVWNEDETKCFYEQIQYDKDVYNEEQAELIISRKKNEGIVGRITNTIDNLTVIFNELRHPRRYENIYWFLLIVLVVVTCFVRGRFDGTAIMVLLGFLVTLGVFAWIGRFLYRTMMPGGVFATLILLYFCDNSTHIEIKHKKYLYLGIVFTAGVLLLMVTTHIPYQRDRASQFDDRNLEAIEYFADHQNNLYLAAQSEAFGIANCVPVFAVPSYEKANLIGNWNMYSESYYGIADSYGISEPDHLVKNIPDSDNIRLIARVSDGVPDCFIGFIRSHSGNENISTELEDTFHTVWMGDWGVYKVVSME